MPFNDNKAIVRRLVEAADQRDFDLVQQLMAPDASFTQWARLWFWIEISSSAFLSGEPELSEFGFKVAISRTPEGIPIGSWASQPLDQFAGCRHRPSVSVAALVSRGSR